MSGQTSVGARHMALLGRGISHSRSPQLFSVLFSAMGVPWSYGLVECADEAAFASALEQGSEFAFNVTTPYKRAALGIACEASSSARSAGGANLLVRCEGAAGFRAWNTDGEGCALFLETRGFPFAGAPCVVCGTGPTARAIAAALARRGAVVTVLSRTAAEGRFAYGSADARHALNEARLVVDATPLGMQPGDPCAFDASLLSAGCTVVDTVYGHGETTLLAAARERGCVAFDGGGMLVGQAAVAFPLVLSAAGLPCARSAQDFFAIMEENHL